MTRAHLRKIVQNTLLVLVSILFTYGIVELFLFKPLLPYLPRTLYHNMVREMRVLGQTSKQGLVPRPGYVAITGDSYAQGKGDWFIETGYNRNARYDSTHLLYDALQKSTPPRDVVSFGRSGAGSVDGVLLEPLQTINFMHKLGLTFPDPGIILVYFYEGNDLANNVDFVQRWFARLHPDTSIYDKATFQKFLSNMVATHATGAARQKRDAPIFANLILRTLRNTLQNSFTRKYIDYETVAPPGKTNAVRVEKETHAIPDHLQSPALHMNEKDKRLALYVFEQCVLFLQKHFPQAKIYVVYLPSPLACYDISSAKVSTFYGKDTLYPSTRVAQSSNAIRSSVADFCESNTLGFIDARAALEQTARTHFIHGPKDWDHLNKKGYETLSQCVLDIISENQ